jgi:hypothetical protein
LTTVPDSPHGLGYRAVGVGDLSGVVIGPNLGPNFLKAVVDGAGRVGQLLLAKPNKTTCPETPQD